MPNTCNRVSGSDGAFKTSNGIVSHVRNWNMGISAPFTGEARSNTMGFQVGVVGAKSGNGGFSVGGTEPVVLIRERGLFEGFTGGGTNGRIYKLGAIVNSMTMNWDFENRSSSTDYQFASDYQAVGDELTIVQSSIIDTSKPRNFQPPNLIPGTGGDPDTYPLVINGTPVCAQNATVTLSAQPNQLSDSCTAGWMTVLGLQAIQGTFSATITCNDMSLVPDVGECCSIQIFTDICDFTKSWQFQYFMITNKDQLNVDVGTGAAVTWNLGASFSVACGCDFATAEPKIITPTGVYILGTAPVSP